jgi:hypothetical protein
VVGTYHGLGTDTIVAIDPDVFCHDFAMLGQVEVLCQLDKVSNRSIIENWIPREGLTFAVYETVVEPAIFGGV